MEQTHSIGNRDFNYNGSPTPTLCGKMTSGSNDPKIVVTIVGRPTCHECRGEWEMAMSIIFPDVQA